MSLEYEIEYAKSSRAACKICKDKIEKDFVRIGTKLQSDKSDAGKVSHILEATRWHHFHCFPKIKKATKWFVDNLPDASACTGFDALKPEVQEKVIALFDFCKGTIAAQPEAPAGPVHEPTTPTGLDEKKGRGKKRGAQASGPGPPELNEMTPAEKKNKPSGGRGGASEEQLSKLQRHKNMLVKKSVAQLAAQLAINSLAKSGKKEELVDRVAECRVFGVLPLCPSCEKGRLKWNRDNGQHSCPGHFDETSKRMVRCKGPEKTLEILRLPWTEDGNWQDEGEEAEAPAEEVSTQPQGSFEKSAGAGASVLFKMLVSKAKVEGNSAVANGLDQHAQVVLAGKETSPTLIETILLPAPTSGTPPEKISYSLEQVAVPQLQAAFMQPIRRSKYFMNK